MRETRTAEAAGVPETGARGGRPPPTPLRWGLAPRPPFPWLTPPQAALRGGGTRATPCVCPSHLTFYLTELGGTPPPDPPEGCLRSKKGGSGRPPKPPCHLDRTTST